MSQKKLNSEELETRLQFYKLKAEHLEHQLAKKDEEIKDLKEYLGKALGFLEYRKSQIKLWNDFIRKA